MKKIIAAAAMLTAMAISCRNNEVKQQILTGDLLFVGIPMDYQADNMAQAIADATGGSDEINYIHTAVLEVDSLGAIWVIDATLAHGVDRHPLDTLFKDFTLNDGGRATFKVMRLKDNGDAARHVEQCKALLGEEYDLYFLPANGRHYCTELVYDCYLKRDGSHIFDSEPMNFKNSEGEMPDYWTWLFGELGQSVPQGVPGTNPQGMFNSSALKYIADL